MLKFIIIFTIASFLDVMLNTFKTIIMYKQNKWASSCVNAITYGFYTWVVVLMAGDMPLYIKIVIVALTNFIGVWLSMLILEKIRKDKLWLVDVTCKKTDVVPMSQQLTRLNVPYSVINIENGEFELFKIYCNTHKETESVGYILRQFDTKYFVTENKTTLR